MRNSLNELWISWLNEYHFISKDHKVLPLIAALTKTTKIEALIELFSDYLEPQIAQYRIINLNAQLTIWKRALEKVIIDHQQALTQLNNIIVTKENKKLVMLLHEILSDPKLLLHLQMPSLLQAICNNPLEELIDYIIHIPKVAFPVNQSLRCSPAQKPISLQYAACQTLLKNLSAINEGSNPLWMKANSLLRSAFLMYKELDLIEVSLDDDKTIEELIENQDEEETNCIIL